MKYTKILSALLIGLTVTACNYETQVTLKASDLTKDTAGNPIFAPIILQGKGTFSEDECEKIRGKAEPSIQKYFKKVEFKGCSRDPGDIDRKVTFNASAPVYVGAEEDGWDFLDFSHPYGLVISYNKDTPNKKTLIAFKGKSYDAFAKELDKALTGSKLGKDGAGIIVKIQNDTPNMITFNGDSFFVNGKAYGRAGDAYFSMPQNSSIKVQLSDTSAKYLMSSGTEMIGWIDFAPK